MRVSEGVKVFVGDPVRVGEPLGVRVGVSVGESVGVRVAVAVAVGGRVPVIVGIGVGVSVGSKVFVGVKLIVGVAVASACRGCRRRECQARAWWDRIRWDCDSTSVLPSGNGCPSLSG